VQSVQFHNKDWAVIDKKKIDMFEVKLQQEGGLNMHSWNKVVKSKHLLPNTEIQRLAFLKYQNL